MARQIPRQLAFCKPGAWTALNRRVTSQAVSEAAAAAVVKGTLYFRAALLNALRIPKNFTSNVSIRRSALLQAPDVQTTSAHSHNQGVLARHQSECLDSAQARIPFVIVVVH